ncbi:MAG: choice-of-anchor V domain-containing protein [Saprospiraceae bacterium]
MNFSKTNSILQLFCLCFCTFLFTNYSGNPPNGLTGAPGENTCRNCHSGNNAQGLDGEVLISGLPESVTAGTTYPISVTVTNPNGLSLRAGFQMVALNSNEENAGILANPSENSTVVAGNRVYHEHAPAIAYDSDRNATWTVDWIAPQTTDNETVTFYATGNITDSNDWSDTTNDLIVFATQRTTVSEDDGGGGQQAADLEVTNLQNFPAAVRRGEAAFYNFDVVNSGNVIATGEYDILMYLSTDQLFSDDDIEAGVVPTGNTPIGTISEVTGGITAPVDLPLGNYYLLIVIDANNTIEELNEDNNVLVSNSTINVLPANNPLTLNIDSQDISCAGENNGSATAVVNGGNGAYQYNWSNGATSAFIDSLPFGEYTVTVTDSDGEEISANTFINEPEDLQVEIVEVINNDCPNDENGVIAINAIGGTPPYVYEWSNGDTDNSTNGLPPGEHTVLITDANGCANQQIFNLVTNDEESPVITCPDNIVINNCDVPTEYSAPTATDNCSIESIDLIDGLASGSIFPAGVTTITYRTYDSSDNVATCSFTITIDNDLVVNIDDTTPATDTDANGVANITVNGGTLPYTFQWILGDVVVSEEEDPTNLVAGDYTLEIRDAKGCTFIGMPVTIDMTTDVFAPAFAENIKLFPNPVREKLMVQITDLNADMQIEIVNLFGQMVHQEQLKNTNSDNYFIDLQSISKGSYFVRISVNDAILVEKITVQ